MMTKVSPLAAPPARRTFLQGAAALALGMAMPRTSTPAIAASPSDGAPTRPGRSGTVTLFLAGDVMTGRGIDQALPYPGDPLLHEPYVKSAREYLALAARANGRIARPVDFAYVWGDALAELDRRRPDVRVVNLETAVTRSARPAPKGIHYKMNPANMPVLAAAALDCCTLANNHVLDWGRDGLLDTLAALEAAGIKAAGAGRDLRAARAPAVLERADGGRVLVFAFGAPTAGIPDHWAAGERRPGVNLVADLSAASARRLAPDIRAAKRPGDVVVASLHWGPNWGYAVPDEQVAFAHALIDEAGVDIVFGHSSHHAKAIEVHRGRLIVYGSGDFLNDYEGIAGYEAYRGDLAVMYLPELRAADGALLRLDLAAFQVRNFRLNRAGAADIAWLADTLGREGRRFGTRVVPGADGALALARG